MATTVAPAYAPDHVETLHDVSDPLEHYLALVGGEVKGHPLLKCGAEGRMTLVSPGKTHEESDCRLDMLIMAVCSVLQISFKAHRSRLYPVPGTRRGYMPDESYFIQRYREAADPTRYPSPPDLVTEIVVTHPAADALIDCALLSVPEIWVWDIPRGELTFYLLQTRGRHKGQYRPGPTSRVLPMLHLAEVIERLKDPTTDDGQFLRNCQACAEQVLVPRQRGQQGDK
jgi:Uma2 family endonuclease